MHRAYVNEITTMELAMSDYFIACQLSNLGSNRELLNQARATFKWDLWNVKRIHDTSSGELLL
jgi:hypothetical protein